MIGNLLKGPFGKHLTEYAREMERKRYEQSCAEMRESMARETPEQKQRFYLEVAAQLGNESAARALAEMEPDPERAKLHDDLIEQVIFLTRRVHELERRLDVPHDVVREHLQGARDQLYFRKEIN